MKKNTIVTTARTVEDAIELALKQLDVNREEVEIDVVSRGKAGLLGIGFEEAQVRVSIVDFGPDEIAGDVVKTVSNVLDNLLIFKYFYDIYQEVVLSIFSKDISLTS